MLLEIRDLQVNLHVSREVLHVLCGVHISLERGDRLALVGESGSGKTMTGLSVMRLLPTSARVISGQVFLDGTDLLSMPEREASKLRGKKIAMIFQNALTSLNPLIRIGDQIADIYRRNTDQSKREAWEKAIKALEVTGIPNPADRARNFPHEFSGGMAQRVLIALALASEPTLLIADEPTSGLDVTIQAQIIALINEVAQRLNMTLIVISHDIGVVSKICNRIAVMYAGTVMESGTTEQVIRHSANPYTRALIECATGQPEDRRMPYIPGRVVDLRQEWKGCPFAPRCAYAKDICANEAPPEVELSKGHISRCHFAEQLADYQKGVRQ